MDTYVVETVRKAEMLGENSITCCLRKGEPITEPLAKNKASTVQSPHQ